jgi:hypothetical protein
MGRPTDLPHLYVSGLAVPGVEQGKQCEVCLNDCSAPTDYVDKQHDQR